MNKFIEPYLGVLKAAFIVAAVLAIFYAGMRVQAAGELKRQLAAVERARADDRKLQDEIDASTSDYINRLHQQERAAHVLPKITLVNDCPVPASVGGVLNDAQRMHADAGIGSGTGAARTEVDSTCAAELDIAKRNYAEVCIPNAEQLTAIQNLWGLTRSAINGLKRPAN